LKPDGEFSDASFQIPEGFFAVSRLGDFPRCFFCRRAGQVKPQSRQASKGKRVMRTCRDRGWFWGGIEFEFEWGRGGDEDVTTLLQIGIAS